MTYSYSKAYSQYGASMGRPRDLPEDTAAPIKLHLERVRLDSGGYDKGGAYWGTGLRLYVAWADDVQLFYRGATREQIKAFVREQIPNARFYR